MDNVMGLSPGMGWAVGTKSLCGDKVTLRWYVQTGSGGWGRGIVGKVGYIGKYSCNVTYMYSS